MNRPHSCPRRARLPATLSFVLCCALLPFALAGCGNKGPLVLPEDAPPAQAVTAPADASADAPPTEAPPADVSSTDAPPADAPADTPDPPRAHD